MAAWTKDMSQSVRIAELWSKPLFFPSSIFSILMLYSSFFIKIVVDSSRIYKELITLSYIKFPRALGNGDTIFLADAKHPVRTCPGF